jgi:indolepyruvate ferredoxin oxidoreductase
MNIALRDVSLNDRYTQSSGTLFLSGTQALVRLLITQRDRDRKAGLNTAGFVSGYRGSPLGALDMELWKSRDMLKSASVIFQPGVNEDLAATSVWGTQQIDSLPGRTVDGVFAMWYGKGPGVDRSGDPFKHGNYAGTTEHGGVLVVFGDDHPGKSSTVAHQSEQALAANLIPVLYPSNVEEILEYGLHGWALSRFSGLWVGLKTVNETVETTSTVNVSEDMVEITLPTPLDAVTDIRPQLDYGPQRDETVVIRHRLPRIHEYARANRLDLRNLGKSGAKLGIISSGKAYADLTDALSNLGIDETRAQALGISVYKVGLIWPLEPSNIKAFAEGCDELFFIEEKRAFLEDQTAKILINEKIRPILTGKLDPAGEVVLPSDIQLNPLMIAEAIMKRMEALGLADDELREAFRRSHAGEVAKVDPSQPRRLPYFCSGCPHNSSTKVPEGSVALSGIGCHSMAMWMNRDTLKPVQMGAEGSNWIGLSHFTTTKHVFQNLGDGTYSHSGLLAIRAAVLSKVNITYKILANDAVAMTGGQPIEGALTTEMIVRQVLAEDVERCVVVTDDLDRTAINISGVDVVARGELDRVQRELSQIEGTTVLVYEQVCAAEKRRRRKRKLMPDPATRVFINEDVCEGCGDCSVQSNCVSIMPKETEFGRKRSIDQSSCNKDMSCIEGFCPSFVIIEGGKLRANEGALDRAQFESLPDVDVPDFDTCNVLITGVGGTGVVTIGSVLAMAANLIGKGANSYNMTGLAQKGGAVFSHLRLASRPDDLRGSQIGPKSADVVLGCDLVTAASADGLKTYSTGKTRALLNGKPDPTSAFQFDRDFKIDEFGLATKVQSVTAEAVVVDAGEIAQRMLGDKIGANMFIVGYAFQKGWLPLPMNALRKAIELNGAAVPFNLDAFDLGRLAAFNPDAISNNAPPARKLETLNDIVTHHAGHLVRYQGKRWAAQYTNWVDRVRQAEQRVTPGSNALAIAVARNLSKLMSYKDEYEVARLYAETAWKARLSDTFDSPQRLSLYLAPPMLSRPDPITGRPKKMRFGPWIFPAMNVLSKFKMLRGTPLDPFGRHHDRRKERRLIAEYESDLELVLTQLNAGNLSTAVEWATIPDNIRGFGPVKNKAIEKAATKRSVVLSKLQKA